MRAILVVILATILAGSVYSQTIKNPLKQNLAWSYSNVLNGRNGETLVLPGKLVTRPDQQVQWIQDGGEFVETFTISGVAGSWTNLDNDGSVVFNVTIRESGGTIKFSSLDSVLMGEIHLTNPGREDTRFSFYITAVAEQ